MAATAAWLLLATASGASAQDRARPMLKAGALNAPVHLDGVLSEAAWASAPLIDNLTMSEPTEGAAPFGATRVRVLAGRRELVFGIECDDPDPSRIVSHTKVRDASLAAEDRVTLVLDTVQDGRSGYVFAVNPGGARYDALIETGGGSENANWDGIWEAATHRDDRGWSVEIRIPITTLAFRRDLHAWGFNVERRIQRLQETDRWSGPSRNYKLTQTRHAGLLSDLPPFDLGIGVSVRPAVTAGGGRSAPGEPLDGSVQPSLDVTRRLGPNLLASLTANTDFAETDVDTRRTNFTRFPLFFPEKRTFFLQGADIFSFGLGLGTSVVPFYSRRVGLVGGREVPIDIGGKVNGRTGGTSVGAEVVHTRDSSGLAPSASLGVVRLKQNVFGESSVGLIATAGDPVGRSGSWLAGGDYTYRTSHFRGNKNLQIGLWGLAMGRDGLGRDRHAEGVSVEYPNDRAQFWFRVRQVGAAFDPSLGFIDRTGIRYLDTKIDYKPRPGAWHIRQYHEEFQVTAVTNLQGQLESWRIFTSWLHLRFESGDTLESNIVPTGERLTKRFEVSPGVFIPPGAYHWTRYRIESQLATKRKVSALATWWFGGFYTGTLQQAVVSGAWSPTGLVTIEVSGERDIGRMATGRFTQTLVGSRLRLNVSPDLQLSSYVQYDSVTRSAGTNSRLRWTVRSAGDLFVIYNHNVRDIQQRWQLDSNQLIVKFQYAFQF